MGFLIAEGDPAFAAEARERSKRMADWIKDFTCRRKGLLKYFGESGAADNCGMCDVCVVTNAAKVEGSDDITPYAFLFLSCVKQVQQGFGIDHIINVLRGSKAQNCSDGSITNFPSMGRAMLSQKWPGTN
jgi:superfamily II DNA helicase RecQ